MNRTTLVGMLAISTAIGTALALPTSQCVARDLQDLQRCENDFGPSGSFPNPFMLQGCVDGAGVNYGGCIAAPDNDTLRDIDNLFLDYLSRLDDCLEVPPAAREQCAAVVLHAFCVDLRNLLGNVPIFGCPPVATMATHPTVRDSSTGRVFSNVDSNSLGAVVSTLLVYTWTGESFQSRFADVSVLGDDIHASIVLDASAVDIMDSAVVRGVWLHHDADGHVLAGEVVRDVYDRGIHATDWNRDGFIDSTDLILFLGSHTRSAPRADVDGDGEIDGADIVAFVDLMP